LSQPFPLPWLSAQRFRFRTHDRMFTLIREYETELGIIDSMDDPS
jgi:hypothetical protein